MLLEIKVQVVPITVFKNGAEGIGINFEDVKQANDPRMVQLFVDVVLSEGVLDIIGLLVVLPIFIQLVHFASHVPLFLQSDTISISWSS